MSDISIPLSRAMDAQLPVPIDRIAAADTPLGLWTTLGWGAATIAAAYLTWLIPIVLSAIAGSPVAMPAVLQHLPIDHMAIAALIAAALWFNRRPLRQYLAVSRLGLGGIGRSIGIGIAAYIGFVILVGGLELLRSGVDGGQSAPAMPKIVFDTGMIVWLIAYWFLLVVAAPIVEEMQFRGLLYRGLEPRIGALATIAITSVVFGLLHYLGFGWPRAVATGCLGFILGVIRWRTGNTTACMVTHATINFMAASFFTAMILLAAYMPLA
jgi:uncharacterized protein